MTLAPHQPLPLLYFSTSPASSLSSSLPFTNSAVWSKALQDSYIYILYSRVDVRERWGACHSFSSSSFTGSSLWFGLPTLHAANSPRIFSLELQPLLIRYGGGWACLVLLFRRTCETLSKVGSRSGRLFCLAYKIVNSHITRTTDLSTTLFLPGC